MKNLLTRRNLAFLLRLSAVKGVGMAAGMSLPVVVLRYLGAEAAGQLAYLTALFLAPAIFYSNLPTGVVRFGSTAAPRERAELFAVHALLAALVLVVLGAATAPWLVLRPGSLLGPLAGRFGDGQELLVVVLLIVSVPASLAVDMLGAYASAAGRVQGSQLRLALRPIISLAGVMALVIAVDDPALGLIGVLAARLLGHLAAGAAFLAPGGCDGLASGLAAVGARRLPALCAAHWRTRLRNYLLPLQVSSIIAYVKDNLAVLLLGRMGLLGELAYFDVLKRIFDVPRKLAPGFLNVVMPIMLRRLAKERARFKEDFTLLAWSQFVLMAATGTVLIMAHRPLGELVGAQVAPEFRVLVHLFAINLLINSQAQSNAYLIQLGDDTRGYMLTTLVRLAVVTVLTLVLVPRYGSVGGCLALILSTVAVGFLTSLETRRIGLTDWASSVRQAGLALVVCGAWAVSLMWVEG